MNLTDKASRKFEYLKYFSPHRSAEAIDSRGNHTMVREDGRRAITSNRHVGCREVSLNGLVAMRRQATDCWNRDEKGQFGPFYVLQNKKSGFVGEVDGHRALPGSSRQNCRPTMGIRIQRPASGPKVQRPYACKEAVLSECSVREDCRAFSACFGQLGVERLLPAMFRMTARTLRSWNE